MANPKGSWYSAYVWKFANARENATLFKDFVSEEYDLGFRIICIFFVILGAGGMFLNGSKLFVFWRLKTVSTQLLSNRHKNELFYNLEIRKIIPFILF